MDRISIEFISVFGLPPVEFVNLAADLYCQYISMGLAPMTSNPHNYPLWSLREDTVLRRDMIAAIGDRGISISLGEGFIVRSGADVRDQAGDLDLMAELGIKRVNIVSIEPDADRSLDQFSSFVEMADALGMETTLEFLPGFPVGDLAAALSTIKHIDNPNFRLLIDMMHLFRTGSSAADIAALDPGLIGYAQLCDVPLVSQDDQYMEEARNERLAPGAGELPLLDAVKALPRDIILGLEVPLLKQAQAGIAPMERLAPCVKAARELLAQLKE
jgi:sugar phosphate isomerase/epimerase